METGKDILQRYLNGSATEQEKALVETWYNQSTDQAAETLSEQELMETLEAMERALPLSLNRRRLVYRRLVGMAAAILIIVVAGWWMYDLKTPEKTKPATAIVAHKEEVIVPGGNKAILTLADGKKISLTDAATGNIASEAGVSIEKTANGQMVYRIGATASAATGIFNTIETPVGGQYQVQLPDGTQVWLNAKSSLRFPVHFSETARQVEITGEAYFEVAHDKSKPFRVINRGQQIEVLGTHFNINAYDNEGAIKTTLLEGSVKVSANGLQTVLKPNEQAIVAAGAAIRTYDNINTEDVVAWKNNKIQFTDLDIQSIMRMLERWYNIEVVYEGQPVHTTFGASVSRSKNIDVIIKLLEATGDIHFKTQGRRITVMP